MSDDPFAPLRREYLDGAGEKACELEVQQKAAHPDLQVLRRLAHNLRGSGGFYGFVGISKAAATLEELAIAGLEGERPAEAAIAAAIETLLAEITKARS